MASLKDIGIIMVVLCGLLLMAGCTDPTGGGGTGTGSGTGTTKGGIFAGKVEVTSSVVPSNPEPGDRIKLKISVKNGLLDAIEDVKALVLTDPVNMEIDKGNMWKTIALNMKNGDEDDEKWTVAVKAKTDFVPAMNPEKLKVRIKYKTSVKAANTFKISDSADTKESGSTTTESEIVPIVIEVDPQEVPLDKDAEVSIEITVKKGITDNSGVLEDKIPQLIINVPRADDFDLAKSTCEYEDATSTKMCKILDNKVTLENVSFDNDEFQVRIILPLKESSLSNLRGTQKAITVSLEGVWLYQDRDVEVSYSLTG
ncbi:MAG: hypothetical protein QF415_16655 [Candidatus Undinarchaeales archaeon]|jgi:hypothetical protein|nr:hypothetical protein [Candidatus Undinarchaeales archaeon]MDP7492350.1 hypothetical protein [Candidatus Undinarchaeales archaeon]